MNHYKYINSRNKTIIFECDAKNILVADRRFTKATGIHAEKAHHVMCRSEPIGRISWLNVARSLGIYALRNIGSALSLIRRKLRLKKPAVT